MEPENPLPHSQDLYFYRVFSVAMSLHNMQEDMGMELYIANDTAGVVPLIPNSGFLRHLMVFQLLKDAFAFLTLWSSTVYTKARQRNISSAI
jgi:hypothetical protein